ncbi:MAG: hypothetical protein WKF97_14085 [Chitinophagaceae bacterium]
MKCNLSCAGDLKPFLGTRIRSNLWHVVTFYNYTLLAAPHRRYTYGALWAMMAAMNTAILKMERKGKQSIQTILKKNRISG